MEQRKGTLPKLSDWVDLNISSVVARPNPWTPPGTTIKGYYKIHQIGEKPAVSITATGESRINTIIDMNANTTTFTADDGTTTTATIITDNVSECTDTIVASPSFPMGAYSDTPTNEVDADTTTAPTTDEGTTETDIVIDVILVATVAD